MPGGNTVTIKVDVNGDKDALTKLRTIKTQIDAINKTPINIEVNASGFNQIDNSLRKTISAMAQYKAAAAAQTAANNQLAHDEYQLKIAIEQTKQARANARSEKQKSARVDTELQIAQEKTTQSENRATAAAENRGAAEARKAAAEEKTKQKEIQLQIETEKTAQKMRKAAEDATFFGNSAVKAMDQFWSRLETRALHAFFNQVRRSFNEALDMIHDVDDELVTVRKVSQWDSETMAAVEANAYKVAQTYGVAANDYLENVAEFVRAGYREDAEALAELAIKTQIVGDTTAEVANQFLLSTDKAYQFGGSIEELGKVLDGVNEIDNNFATSIDKIASGMGIVAPVASQMHVSVDELAASIGTITAVTQRTGTEAARALRAIFLNIVGDTKTEIDEGVTWTTGEIAGLRDVIKKYAPEAYAAAEATGSIIDPMEAIAGLSKSMEEGLLTEQELMSMISDIGGKLRSSQLLALIQNWDMYSDMLTKFEDAAGSADQEVTNALNSWTRKSEQLKVAWAELVSNYLNSDTIKRILDGLRSVVEWLDKNHWAINTLIGLLAVVAASTWGVHMASQAAKAYEAVQSLVSLFQHTLIPMLTSISEKVIPVINAAMEAMAGSVFGIFAEILGGIGIVFAEIAAVYAIDKAADNARHKKTNEAIQSGDVEQSATMMGREMQNGVVGRLNTWRGNGVSTGLAINEGIMNEGAYSDELKLMMAQTKMSFGTIENERQLTGYYNRLLKLKEQFEKEGIDDDMYQWILGDIKEYAPVVQEYEDYLNLMRESNQEAAESFDELAEQTGLPITSLNALREALSAANAELEQYNNEIAGGEKGDTLGTYKGIYDSAMEQFESGHVGSNQFQAAMRLLLPDSVLREIGYDYQKAGELASSAWFQAIMDGTEDGGVQFANKLYDISTISAEGVRGVFDELGNSIVTITEGEDGSFGLVIDDFEALGEVIGVDAEVLVAMADKIDLLNEGLNLSKQDVLEMANHAGALTEQVGKFPTIDVEKLFNAIVEGGKNAKKSTQEIESDLYHMQDALTDMEDVNLSVPFAELDGLREKALDAAQSAEDTETGLNDLNDTEANPTVELDHTVFDAQLKIVNDKLDRLASRKVTVGATIQQQAEGTEHASAGLALTGELGPELVQESTGARIVGLDGPELTVLEEGAKVYTAEETQAILNRKGSARIPTFWAGGVFSRTSSTTPAKKSGATSSSKKSSAGKSWLTDAQKKKIEAHEAVVSLLESELSLLEAQDKPIRDQVAKAYEIQNALLDQIKYMESIGAEQEDINKLYVEWYNWNDKIAKLQKQVFDGLDDAIDNELKEIKEYYDGLTDEIDAQIDALKEAKDLKEDELELEEKLLAVETARTNLANAQRERTVRMYNAATGQWEWVADAKKVQSAQDALTKAEEALTKYQEDAEYNAQVDALKAQKEALKAEYDEIEAQWKEVLEMLEDPAKTLSEVLVDIAKNATDDMIPTLEALNEKLAQFGYAINIGALGKGDYIKTTAKKYDSGGLLFGLGGIKATSATEGVLPPDVTAAMLSPQANEVFAQRLSELRYLYGATGTPATMVAGGSRIGSQHNGNVTNYTMNGVTLTEAQARTTTVYELAQKSRNLSLYRYAN